MTDGARVVVDFRRYRLLRMLQEASGQQDAVVRIIRAREKDLSRVTRALDSAQGHLCRASFTCAVLLVHLAEQRAFREACQAAAELTDLDEMVRRRDELAERFNLRAQFGGTMGQAPDQDRTVGDHPVPREGA